MMATLRLHLVRRGALLLAALFAPGALSAGPYSSGLANSTPGAIDPGIPGFVGPAGDGVVTGGNFVNPLFTGWADTVVQYSPAPGVSVGFSNATLALGPVTGDNFDVVSLGDLANPGPGSTPGSITLKFSTSIVNGTGADFAVFENGLISQGGSGVSGQIFGELAYVEVSSDGSNFARFQSISLTSSPVGPYGTIDPTNIYNLAGKHANGDDGSWGTPFDLATLASNPLVLNGSVDLSSIQYVRIVDIPGNGFYTDSAGHPIYDPWLTTGSAGFDLEAIGALHQAPEPTSAALIALGLGVSLFRRRR